MVIGANLERSLIFSHNIPTGQHVAIHSIDSYHLTLGKPGTIIE